MGAFLSEDSEEPLICTEVARVDELCRLVAIDLNSSRLLALVCMGMAKKLEPAPLSGSSNYSSVQRRPMTLDVFGSLFRNYACNPIGVPDFVRALGTFTLREKQNYRRLC